MWSRNWALSRPRIMQARNGHSGCVCRVQQSTTWKEHSLTAPILRTHLLRPTWHFVTPGDIRWMLALTVRRVHAANAYMYRKLELNDAVFKRSNAVLAEALKGGNHLTRDELRDEVQKAGIAADGEFRMGYIMMQAELDGVVCSGGRREKQFTYALLDDRALNAKIRDRDDGLVELARRYFMSRGPATVQDFAKWSGLTLADARTGLEAISAQLQHEVVGGRTYWFSAPERSTNEIQLTAYLLSTMMNIWLFIKIEAR